MTSEVPQAISLILSPRTVQEALSLLISTAYMKSCDTLSLFVTYSGHVNLLSVHYYPGGYDNNPEDYTTLGDVYLDHKNSLSELVELHNKMLEL